jgi:predicted GIY-YIG superfamily endonuclease
MYILQCADGSYYVGSTIDLEQRVAQHNAGEGASYTKKRRPVKLVFAQEFPDVKQAYEREKQVQAWSRAKREALINGEWEKLPVLARKDFTAYHARHNTDKSSRSEDQSNC